MAPNSNDKQQAVVDEAEEEQRRWEAELRERLVAQGAKMDYASRLKAVEGNILKAAAAAETTNNNIEVLLEYIASKN